MKRYTARKLQDRKDLPFYRDKKGRVGFNPRPGVNIDYGVVFFPGKGHRVFFNYHDTPELKNTWGVESLRNWTNAMEPVDTEQRYWKAILYQQCSLADRMNEDWEIAGRPIEGVPEPKETMQ